MNTANKEPCPWPQLTSASLETAKPTNTHYREVDFFLGGKMLNLVTFGGSILSIIVSLGAQALPY